MRRVAMFSLLLFSLTAADSVMAIVIGGPTIIIPVIGRFPGDGGTLWRTDVFLYNQYADPQTVTLKFYSNTGLRQHTLVMNGYQTLVFKDIVLNTYGLEGAGGPLEIQTTDRIEARARIYNAGNPAGQFGQGVEGLEKSKLGRQALMYGLDGTSGNRVNVGVTNPNDSEITVTMSIQNRDNGSLYSETFTVAAHGYQQFNNIVATYSIPPQDGIRVQFNTFELPIYGFASEVRNDTGDATFVFGESVNTGPF